MKIKLLHIMLLLLGIILTNTSFGFFPEYETEIIEKGTHIIEQEAKQSITSNNEKLQKAKDIYKKGKYKNKDDKNIISDYITIVDRKPVSKGEKELTDNTIIKNNIYTESVNLLSSNIYYNRTSAVNYAIKWAYGRNQNYSYYNNGLKDCTNFTSQALQAGGFPYIIDRLLGKYSDKNWYYVNTRNAEPSYTWGGANNFYSHAKYYTNKYQAISSLADLQIGDIIQADWTRDGTVDHSMIITEKTGNSASQIKLTYHSTDTLNKKFSDLISAYPNAQYLGWKIIY